ncbi:MAG: metallophosphoesterase family protein [Gammaproteobacteria bacterium]
MKNLAWVTDIHLDFLDRIEIERFCAEISSAKPDFLLVGGDIGQADSVFGYLQELADWLQKPVYFVFGNHDYYNGSITGVRKMAGTAIQRIRNLVCLENAGVVELTRVTALVGHGGWGDGRLGDYDRSPLLLNDFFRIEELKGLDQVQRLHELQRLGDEAAAYLDRVAREALARFNELIVLTHVPPFEEACRYRGQIAGPDWLPFFTCEAVGRILKEIMEQHPEKHMQVLCGHSHHEASVHILPNLFVQAGTAEYGAPSLQSVFRIE